MANRLSKSDYFVAYMIIISLACFVGGFFLGASVMKSKIQHEQAVMAEQAEKERLQKELKPYREQDFVTFYYSIYQPLKSFEAEHFRYLASLPGKAKRDQLAASEEMQKLAEDKRAEVEKRAVPTTSPLLLNAKQEYLASLQAYEEGMDRLLGEKESAAKLTEADVEQQLRPFRTRWLRAQADLYKAIALWEEMHVTKKPMPREVPAILPISQWRSYPFHYRNYLSAEYMYRQNQLAAFHPEDLTARLDAVVLSNQAGALGWKDIPFAVRALYATDAVREGDFRQLRGKLYPDLKAPEIPLFTE